MPDVQDPPAKEEQKHRESGMAKWMAGLAEALPNPSVGGAQQDPEPEPEPEPIPEKEPTPEKEPVKEPETPAEPKTEPVPKTEPEEARWPRSAKEWKHFTGVQKAKTEEYQKQITERDARIKDLEAKTKIAITPEVQAQIDGLKKENEEYSKQLRLLAVTTHPKFKNYFGSKINTSLSQLKYCVPADQLEAVTKLVQEPDSDHKENAINLLLADMTELQKMRFNGVVNTLSAIDAEREAEVARAQQDYEQMVAQAKAQREGQQASFTKLLEDTVKTMQDGKTGRPEYQLREGETEWNASVLKRIESGKSLITGNLAPEVMFKAAFDAAAYPDVLTGYKQALAEIEKLKGQIAKMTAANPRIESAKRTETNGTNGNEPKLPKDARPMDHTANWVKRFGAAMRGDV